MDDQSRSIIRNVKGPGMRLRSSLSLQTGLSWGDEDEEEKEKEKDRWHKGSGMREERKRLICGKLQSAKMISSACWSRNVRLGG